MFTCLTFLVPHVFGVLACLRVYVFGMLASSMYLSAHMSYLLAAPKYFTCFFDIVSLIVLYRKTSFYSEKYLEPT